MPQPKPETRLPHLHPSYGSCPICGWNGTCMLCSAELIQDEPRCIDCHCIMDYVRPGIWQCLVDRCKLYGKGTGRVPNQHQPMYLCSACESGNHSATATDAGLSVDHGVMKCSCKCHEERKEMKRSIDYMAIQVVSRWPDGKIKEWYDGELRASKDEAITDAKAYAKEYKQEYTVIERTIKEIATYGKS